jgi:NADH:ubiquinone oxidoreductase subunit 2 (subunit N)
MTLAPFSFWVVQIYTKLPFLFLFILMGVYKIIYILLFIKLFIYILDAAVLLQPSISFNILLFVLPSMFVGCIAYRAADLKTILAFTTVSQLAYVVAAFAVHDVAAVKYSLLYIIFYICNLSGIFIIFIILQKQFFLVNLNQLFIIKYYSKK